MGVIFPKIQVCDNKKSCLHASLNCLCKNAVKDIDLS